MSDYYRSHLENMSDKGTILKIKDISKEYPSVKANDAVSLDLEYGKIQALLGENGAGKSTLVKIVSRGFRRIIKRPL